MKKVSFATKPSDHLTILLNGFAVYSCHETSGHKIDLFVPSTETSYEFNSANNKIGRASVATNVAEQTNSPTAA